MLWPANHLLTPKNGVMMTRLNSDTSRLPDLARTARLIVCERTSRWVSALRRELPKTQSVYEVRTLRECWAVLKESPASFAVVELDLDNADNLLSLLIDSERSLPLASVAVVASQDMISYEWLMREAGAIHFVTSPRQLKPMGNLAQKHLEKSPKPPQSLIQKIWGLLDIDHQWGSVPEWDL